MRKKLKKNFSLLLALIMVLGIAPLSLFASAEEAKQPIDGSTVEPAYQSIFDSDDPPDDPAKPGIATLIWDMATEPAITGKAAGETFRNAGPVSAGGVFVEPQDPDPEPQPGTFTIFDLKDWLAPRAIGTTVTTWTPATGIGLNRTAAANVITIVDTGDGVKGLRFETGAGNTNAWHGTVIRNLGLVADRDYTFEVAGTTTGLANFIVQMEASPFTRYLELPNVDGAFSATHLIPALPAAQAGVNIRIETNNLEGYTLTEFKITSSVDPNIVPPPAPDTILTTRKDLTIQDAQGWPELARSFGTGIEVTRANAPGGLMFNPEALGLQVGEVYIWEIEGYRIGGTHRAAFGTVNAAGATTINGAAVNMLDNNQGFRPGYFRLARGIMHTDAISAYRFYGVGSGNTTAAAGNFMVTSVTVKKANPYVLFETSFASLDEDISMFTDGSATFDPELFGIIEDPTQPGNYVLRSTIPDGRGGDFWGIALQGAPIDAPLGAMWRVTMDVRKTDGAAGIIRLRAATNLLGAVNNWAAFQVEHNLPVSDNWTQYVTPTALLPDFNGIHAFELMRASQTWTGTLHLNSVKVEVFYQPEDDSPPSWQLDIPSLKDTFADYFKVGNILDRPPSADIEAMFVHHYNAMTMENGMKPDAMSGGPGSYNFANANRTTDWAIANGIEMTGHALVWHSQSATWTHGTAQAPVPHAQARQNMQDFINNVAGNFVGRVVAWDVINEVVASGGGAGSWTQNIRTSPLNNPTHPWTRAYNTQHIPGTPWGALEFIYDAFLFAREAAPDAQLLYNDYNDDSTNKSTNIRDMINAVNARWATDTVNNPQASADFGTAVFTPRTTSNTDATMIAHRAQNIAVIEAYLAARGRLLIEGFGLQAHYGTGTNIATVRAAVGRYAEMPGVRLHVTELDVTTASGHGFGNNPGTPTSGQRMQYRQLFEMYMDNAHLFERITFWGISDNNSWRGSSSPQLFAAPTIFDPVFRAKPVFYDIIGLVDTYDAPGLTAAFADGEKAATFIEGKPISFTIDLGVRGPIALDGTSTNIADYRINGLPEGLNIVSAGDGVITVSGTLPEGTYEIFPWVRKNEVATGTTAVLNRIAGNWVGVRLTEPLVITVEEDPGEPIEATFDLIAAGYAWAEKLTAVVIDLGEGNSIATSELDNDLFTVHAIHNRPTGNAWFFMNRNRVVSNIYASEVNDWGSPADSGRYIVVEFKVWGPYGGLATGDGGGRLRFQYTITANRNVALSSGPVNLVASTFKQSNLNPDGFGFARNAIIDQFVTAQRVHGTTTLTYSTFFNRDEEGNPSMNRPLFIHLHGGGQSGDWRQPLGYSNIGTILAEPEWQERYGSHIIVPINSGAAQLDALAAVIRDMIADGLVDANRIYVSGYSMGGTGTINMMLRHPDLIAAAIPICPASIPINANNINSIKDIPQWWINGEGEHSQAGHSAIWNTVEQFFGRAGSRVVARASLPGFASRPALNNLIANNGLGNQLLDARYTRFWDNNVKAFPYGPDVWLDYRPHNEITEDGFWIFNGHQNWIPAFNGGINVMSDYANGWIPRAMYDGFTPGDSTALFDWMFAQVKSPTNNFSGTSPSQLNALLAQGNVVLQTQSNYGIASGSTLVIPEGKTLYVSTILNVRRDANLIVEGTLVVLEGGRVNNDGHPTAGGGTITIAEGGMLVNDGYVENVSKSSVINNGVITNNARFEVRAGTVFADEGVVRGLSRLNIHRDAVTN